MALYNNTWFPQTNVHEINLDWILQTVAHDQETVDKIAAAYENGDLNGQNFAILGFYDTLDALKTAVQNPKAGDTYGVGVAAPYTIYMYVADDWANLGNLTGPRGAVGPAGKDGVSPAADVSKKGTTATITITDSQGTTTATVTDGTSATVNIRNTVNIPYGQNAKVLNVGTSNDAVLDIFIPAGKPGEAGVGVATGGATGQILAKTSATNYDTQWIDPSSIAPVRSVNGMTGAVTVRGSEVGIPIEQTEAGSVTLTAYTQATLASKNITEAGLYLVIFSANFTTAFTNRAFITINSNRQDFIVNQANNEATVCEIVRYGIGDTCNGNILSVVGGTYAYSAAKLTLLKLSD